MPLLRQFSLVPPSAVVLKFIIKIWVEGGYKCNNLYTSTMIKITFILGFGNIKYETEVGRVQLRKLGVRDNTIFRAL